MKRQKLLHHLRRQGCRTLREGGNHTIVQNPANNRPTRQGNPTPIRSSAVRIVIQVAAQDSAKAWALLVRHSPGTALPKRTFIVSEEAVRSLNEAGINFTEISREPGQAWADGVMTGERI